MSINIISELIPHHSMCEWNIKRNTVHKCECEYAIYLYDNAINEEMITNILTEILYIQYTINAEYIHEKYSSKVIHISMAALYAHIQSKINKPLSDIIIKLPIPIKCDR